MLRPGDKAGISRDVSLGQELRSWRNVLGHKDEGTSARGLDVPEVYIIPLPRSDSYSSLAVNAIIID